jgi:uridylate kinase
MKNNCSEKTSVVALGGSIVFPHKFTDGGLNVPFLTDFRQFVLEQTAIGRRFVLVVGGGKACRLYQHVAQKIADPGPEALDWLGIRATRLNAQLVLDILKEVAHPFVIHYEPSPEEAKILSTCKHKVVVAAGWGPGWSTDYVAIKCAKIFGQKEAIIDGDTAFVFDKDPNKFSGAEPIMDLTWKEYEKLIPEVWTPGMSAPVDPVAARYAQENDIMVKTVKGTDLKNFLKVIDGDLFEGTTIHN